MSGIDEVPNSPRLGSIRREALSERDRERYLRRELATTNLRLNELHDWLGANMNGIRLATAKIEREIPYTPSWIEHLIDQRTSMIQQRIRMEQRQSVYIGYRDQIQQAIIWCEIRPQRFRGPIDFLEETDIEDPDDDGLLDVNFL